MAATPQMFWQVLECCPCYWTMICIILLLGTAISEGVAELCFLLLLPFEPFQWILSWGSGAELFFSSVGFSAQLWPFSTRNCDSSFLTTICQGQESFLKANEVNYFNSNSHSPSLTGQSRKTSLKPLVTYGHSHSFHNTVLGKTNVCVLYTYWIFGNELSLSFPFRWFPHSQMFTGESISARACKIPGIS